MKYGKSWFHLQTFFFIAYFHVLGLFKAKRHVHHAKNHRTLLVEIFIDDISAALRALV
jgi:hypothetical protein